MMHERRHDLDWLRVGAFLLLMLYHVGMFYVPWDWHVKSQSAPIAAIELPMKLSNAWRLPLLFLISGVALRFALDKTSEVALLRRRLRVLFVPVIFGMYVICAPQAWHELTQQGEWSGSVWEFYRGYIDWPWSSPQGWPIITPTWNHLWYVLYILVFTVLLVLLRWLFGHRTDKPDAAPMLIASLYLCPLIQIALMLLLFESVGAAQTLYGDWYNLIVSFLIMAFGFLIAKDPAIWAHLRYARYRSLALAGGMSVLVGVLHLSDVSHRIDLGVRIIQGWCVIWTVLGWSQVLLSFSTPLLRYLSAAVFTYYILHQTIIIMVGVPLTALNLPLWAEVATLLSTTAFLCWAGYELVAKRIGSWGILMGARNGR